MSAATAFRGQRVSPTGKAPTDPGRWPVRESRTGRRPGESGSRDLSEPDAGAGAAARTRAAGAAAGCAPRRCGRGAARQRLGAGVPTRWLARKCPVSGCGGGGRNASPPSGQICASSASSEVAPRPSMPSVLGRRRNRHPLATLSAPAAQHRPAPPGLHPCPESVLILAPPIARLIRPFHTSCPSHAGAKTSRTELFRSRLTFPHRRGTIVVPYQTAYQK